MSLLMGGTRGSPPRRASRQSWADPGRRPPLSAFLGRRQLLVLSLFAASFAALQFVSARQRSATWDEPVHIAAGYEALTRQDFRVEPTHPPLLRMWAALPLLAMSISAMDTSETDVAPASAWMNGGAYDAARRFLYTDNDADRVLAWTRAMVVALGVIGGVLVFAWSFEWLGFGPAVFALVFYLLSPNIAAHTALVTTDAGVAIFFFGAAYFLWRTCREPGLLNVGALTVCVALAVTTKFSGLALGPIVATMLAWTVMRKRMAPQRAMGIASVIAGVTVLAVWAAYGFRYAPGPGDASLLAFDQGTSGLVRESPLASILGWIDGHRLLPNAFTQGLLFSLQTQVNTAYLAGTYAAGGWWYYFPFAFLIKTPLAFLLLLGTGAVTYIRRRSQLGVENELFVLVPALGYLALAMSSSFNVGLRHILPVYPFTILIAAAAVQQFLSMRPDKSRSVLAAVTLVAAIEFVSVFPYTLTFFNQLVGGPRNGFRYLADSNLSWGQSLKPLKMWMEQQDVDHVNLAYFGQADPAYYGIDATHLPGSPMFLETAITRPRLPGYVAISSTVLSGPYLQPRWRLFYRGFWDRQPVAVIGNSMRVYWVDAWPDANYAAEPALPVESHLALAEASMVALGWPELAAAHFRHYLSERPNDQRGVIGLASALELGGDPREALAVLRRSGDMAATADGQWLLRIAALYFRLGAELRDPAALDEAERYAVRTMLVMSPTSAVHDLLGRVYFLQGHLADARRQLERATQLDPTNANARRLIARIDAMR